MKKVFVLVVFLIVLTFLFLDRESSVRKVEEQEEMRGVFISYMELSNYIRNKDISTAKLNIKKMIEKIANNKLNTIILQIRSHDDAIYDSEYFPISKNIILKDSSYFDVLDFFIKEAKKKNIDLYLWINPYRITSINEEISSTKYAFKYKDTNIVKKVDGIYYYNPASEKVTEHIINGIKEVVRKYQFKGLLFDDYFYPSNDIDILDYEEFLKKEKISIEEYHLNVINSFIKRCYKEIKSINNKVLFGISPDGNIDNNYHKNYADIKTWCSSNNYIDFIMPQIYYGFNNSSKPYIDTINEWDSLVTNDIKLYYALAFYKVGNIDNYAQNGSNEWINNTDIIKKQILIARNTSNYSGFSLFRYDNLFNKKISNNNTEKELNNLKNTLKSK